MQLLSRNSIKWEINIKNLSNKKQKTLLNYTIKCKLLLFREIIVPTLFHKFLKNTDSVIFGFLTTSNFN